MRTVRCLCIDPVKWFIALQRCIDVSEGNEKIAIMVDMGAIYIVASRKNMMIVDIVEGISKKGPEMASISMEHDEICRLAKYSLDIMIACEDVELSISVNDNNLIMRNGGLAEKFEVINECLLDVVKDYLFDIGQTYEFTTFSDGGTALLSQLNTKLNQCIFFEKHQLIIREFANTEEEMVYLFKYSEGMELNSPLRSIEIAGKLLYLLGTRYERSLMFCIDKFNYVILSFDSMMAMLIGKTNTKGVCLHHD